MRWLAILAIVVGSLPEDHVLLVNHTGLDVARFEIDSRKFDTLHGNGEQALVTVTPTKHHLKVVFRGGADVDWPDFNFKGVREIIFVRNHNQIEAHAE